MESPPWMVPPGMKPCPRCGQPVGASYWAQDGDSVHLQCVDWTRQPKPPYYFRLPEIRRRWASLRAELSLVERAGRALRLAHAHWPRDALEHARRVVAVFQQLDMRWPARDVDAEREHKRKLWYDEVGPKDH